MAKSDSVTISKNELTAHNYQLAGLSLVNICKKMKKAESTVCNYLKQYKEKTDFIEIDDVEAEWLDNMVAEAKDGIPKLMKSSKTPAHVKANLYLRIMNAKGILIERKEMGLKGDLTMTTDISKRLDNRISDLTAAIGGKVDKE